jgi:hypothetical protein
LGTQLNPSKEVNAIDLTQSWHDLIGSAVEGWTAADRDTQGRAVHFQRGGQGNSG